MEFGGGGGGGREVLVENAEPNAFVLGLRTKCKPFLLVRVRPAATNQNKNK